MDFGGDTAYVFIAMIVLSDENGYLKHTENALARMICKPVEIVTEAIRNLEMEDPKSNIKAYEGRRIVPLKELMNDETRGWLVVNKEFYRDRASREDKRKSDRERIAEKRNQINGVATCRKESPSVANVAYTDTDTDTSKTIGDKSPEKQKPVDKWWLTHAGIDAKGKEVGLSPHRGESYPEFKRRIFDHLNKPAAAA